MAEKRRVSVGFMGTHVLALKLSEEGLSGLQRALREGEGWHEVRSDDGAVMLNLTNVLFVRVDASEQRVGF